MEFDIGCFEKYRENNRLEVKKAKGGLPVSLWETYSSMSNCHGGTIILGIIEKDDGSFVTTGLKDVEKLKNYRHAEPETWQALELFHRVILSYPKENIEGLSFTEGASLLIFLQWLVSISSLRR